MAVSQQKMREIVLQLLYGLDVGQDDPKALVALMAKELKVAKKVIFEAYERVEKVQAHQAEVDKLIGQTSEEYRFERIGVVERSILRLSLFELLKDEEIPAKVAIAEAIRLTRKFATPESASYVNAILDNVWKGQGEDQ